MNEHKEFSTSSIEEKSSRNTGGIKRVNATLSGPTSRKQNYNLDSKLLYTEYLNALARLRMVEDLQETYKDSLDQQLALQTGKVTKGLQRINEQYSLIRELELKLEIEESGTCSLQTLQVFSETVFNTSFCENLTAVAKFLNEACSVVYLRYIKALQLKTEYDKLDTLINDCLEVSTKFKDGIDNLENGSKLAVEMQKFIDMQNEVVNDITKLQELVNSEQLLNF